MNTTAQYSLINGRLVPAADAMVYLNDLSIQRGFGIFDFFKTVNGLPVFLDDHLDRMLYSAKEMRLDAGLSKASLMEQVNTLNEKNNLQESGIRLTLTGGYASDGYTLSDPNLFITQQPLLLPRSLPAAIQLITHNFQRQMPRVKTIDYLMAVWLQPLIKERAAHDVLYISEDVVRECPRANFFIINREGELQTSKEKLLWGITRKKVLEISAEILPVSPKDISTSDLLNAKEAFITSTTKHITPVSAIDGRLVANGEPGPFTKILSEGYLDLVFGPR